MGIKENDRETHRNLTIHLKHSLTKKMKLYPEVNWSIVARKSFENYVKMREVCIMKKTNPLPEVENEEVESKTE